MAKRSSCPRTSALSLLVLGLLAPACTDAPAISTDPQTEPLNCGASGHSCWGGDCVEGVCQPVKLGDGVGRLVADDNFVAWLGDDYVHGRQLHSYLNAGMRAGDSKLAPAKDAFRLALSGGRAYWAADEGIYACSPNGCDDALVPLVTSNPGFSLREDPFAVVDGTLLWMSRVSDVEFDLRRCAVADCDATATTITRMVQRHATLRPAVLLSDGTWVVLTEGLELRACRLDDCAGTLTTISTRLNFWWSYVGPKNYPASVVALHSGRLFWREEGGRGLMTCQLDSCEPTQFLSADALGIKDQIQVDDDGLYGLTDEGSAVTRFPLAGGEPTTIWKAGEYEHIGQFAVVRDFVLTAQGTVSRVAR